MDRRHKWVARLKNFRGTWWQCKSCKKCCWVESLDSACSKTVAKYMPLFLDNILKPSALLGEFLEKVGQNDPSSF